MTKESTLHRWALLDKGGKTRGTCTAPGRWRARLEFKRMRNGRPLAEGWHIVDRGPVDESVQRAADALHKTLAETKTRPFQVGDRVKISEKGHERYGSGIGNPRGVVGTVDGIDGDGWVGVKFDTGRWNDYQDAESLTLLEPAPQPKAEDEDPPITPLNKPTLRVPAYKAELDTARQEIASLQSEVTSLKAEVNNARSEQERLNHSLADTRSEMMENYHQFSQARDRAEAAEAKLADIKAIMRVNDMVSAIPEDAEPWHFHGLVQTVLDRLVKTVLDR